MILSYIYDRSFASEAWRGGWVVDCKEERWWVASYDALCVYTYIYIYMNVYECVCEGDREEQ